jgi:hypothetical protein
MRTMQDPGEVVVSLGLFEGEVEMIGWWSLLL